MVLTGPQRSKNSITGIAITTHRFNKLKGFSQLNVLETLNVLTRVLQKLLGFLLHLFISLTHNGKQEHEYTDSHKSIRNGSEPTPCKYQAEHSHDVAHTQRQQQV